jgi:RimJ/RimL family protein N-acetyltransferase
MFYELLKTNYNRVKPLFQGMSHSQYLIDAVFEGNHIGRIFVDNPEHPTTALAALACGFHFLVGCADNATFNTAMRERILSELIPTEGDLLLFPTSEAWRDALDALFADFKLLHVTRKAFTFYPERFIAKNNEWQKRVPEGYSIQRYDRFLAGGVGLAEFWGSLDRFLNNGIGFAVMKSDEVISRCHTVMVGNKQAEISIETAEPYRRQGFATLAGCAFIEYCLENGLYPTWSCWDNNIACQILAQKLGFNHPVEIPAIYSKVK